MEYQIIVDSCVDFNEEVFGDPNEIKRIPFQLLIDDEALTDEGLDSDELIRKMKASKRKITTACPSLHDYLEAYKSCAVNYVVTISSRLSGSFQSAMAAKQMLEESGSTSKVYVIDSKSASAGQTLVVLQLKRMLEQRMENSQILLRLSHYITHLQTLFVPAMEKLLNIIRRDAVNMTESVLAITHVDARAKAEELCEKIKSLFSFREVIIFQASGLSTVYADDGGIVLSF